MRTSTLYLFVGLFVLLTMASGKPPYPADAYELTGIRRLERRRLINDGTLPGTKSPPGAMKTLAEIKLNLLPDGTVPSGPLSAFPSPDPDLQKRIDAIFAGRNPNYALAILDITPGRPWRYAGRKPNDFYSPGSVGKLVIAAGLFAELKAIFPNDPVARRALLKRRMVTAGPWVRTNSHTVPIYDPATRHFESRSVRETDVFSLYEWADHMISASSNAAASVVWKEAILLRAFGTNYPPTPELETTFFRETPKAQLREMALSVVNDPLREAGIAEASLQLGSLFTAYGQQTIPGASSYGNPNALLTYLLRIEEGRLVDPWSSLEIKRLMYQTERRIRYASSPSLLTAAVYFKSGSLYRCKQEEGFTCVQYRGNVDNFMNSVATVETSDGRIYMVTLMSNVLRINSAYEHQVLATSVEEVMNR